MGASTPLRIETDDYVDYTQRFSSTQGQIAAVAVLNPALLPPNDRHATVLVKVQYQPGNIMPSGHAFEIALTPDMGARFEDGTMRWRFTYPAFPPHNGAMGTQGVVLSAKAVHAHAPRVQVAAALPVRTTVYYRM